MGDTGLERPPLAPPKTTISTNERAPSGAVDSENAPKDLDLAFIEDRWPSLPEHIRQAVLALVGGGAAER